MTKYEILLLLDPDLDEDRQGEIVGRVRELVEKGDGSWDLHDVWGRRRLAYEIGHKAEGTYHLLQFTSEAATLDEVSRVLRIDDAVMRHMATRRIEGSPARPVAERAPARQDVGTEQAATEPVETKPEEPAEIEQAEIDKAEIDKAEIDKAEIDKAEIDKAEHRPGANGTAVDVEIAPEVEQEEE